MAFDSWDKEDHNISEFNKWEGEDEDDDIKDNWDDEGEEDKSEEEKLKTTAIQVKKKRSMKEIIAEKEETKRKELEARRLKEEELKKSLNPEELLAEKIRQQKMQEESDLEVAKETFGVTLTNSTGIDAMDPKSREEFEEFGKVLVEKLNKFSNSFHYVNFLEDLFRNCCVNLESDDIKKLGSALNILSSEKLKAQKALKGGKKKNKKGGIRVERNDDFDVNTYGDEYDDFI